MATIASALRRPYQPTGIWDWITTVDHKKIGMLYLTTAMIFFLLGGAEALLIRTQLAVPENDLVNPGLYNQLFTMHALTMIFLAIMPISVAFFNLVVPLQIGARDVAFPRLNAFSYWVFLLGGIMLNLGWLFGNSPDAGWFAYANLTTKPFSSGIGLDFYVLGLTILGLSSLAGAFNFIVTIINMRAPGMSLFRMPVFTWMTLITSFLLVLAFPVITVALIELMLDRFVGTNFYAAANGGDPILWQHLFWVFGHPEVYILILPAMGIVSEVLPTFSRKPLFGYPFVVFSGIVIGFMGWAVWSHHMFTTGLGPVALTFFTLSTMFIAVPTGVKVFNWIATTWGGSLDFKTPMLFALGFIALFIIGGLSGVSHAISPSDYQQQDTYYIVAHIHYVLFGGSIMGLFAGIYYWLPKITGRLFNERLGKLHFWLMFIGMNVTFGPQHWVGLDGMIRRTSTYPAGMGWDIWNLLSSIGAYSLGVGILVFVFNYVTSLRSGERASNDPWDGRTLEWSIPTPPPVYNFARIPTVHGRDAFWEQKHGNGHGVHTEHRVPAGGAYGSHETHDSEAHGIHVPGPSYYPLIAAVGIFVLFAGVFFPSFPLERIPFLGLFFPLAGIPFLAPVSILGIVTLLLGIFGWALEPTA